MAHKRKPRATPVDTDTPVFKKKKISGDFIQIVCSDGGMVIAASEFEAWRNENRAAPRYWEVAAGYNTEFSNQKNTLDLTALGATVRLSQVVMLIRFLRMGLINEYNIGATQHVATLFGGCDALDRYQIQLDEDNARKQKEEKEENRRLKENPMTPKEDVYQLFDWRAGVAQLSKAWGNEGFDITVTSVVPHYYYRRKKTGHSGAEEEE